MNQTRLHSNLFAVSNGGALAGAAFMIAAGAAFAVVNTSLQAVTMSMGMAPTAAAFWQYLVAMLCCLPWVMRTGFGVLKTENAGAHILRVVMAAIGVQFWVAGLAHVPIWQAIALIMTSPFFVTLGAGLFLGERVGIARWTATALGFAGGMIILAPWSDAFTAATMLPVAAAVFWAATSLMTKRLTKFESTRTITLYMLVLLTPINAGLAAGSGGFAVPDLSAAALVVLAGAMTMAAQWLIVRAYASADAAYVQPFDHVKLPLNIMAGWIVFGFVPGGNLWLGSLLIVSASIFIAHRETRQASLARA
ncbi:DMT family transporter [Hoeflea prorocentri]|uniref:DMT family transporter n=1 Tax=Hoeflea prorocentri TaxID=1922333 RepID=A0A9X3ZHU4_9HYPH|nr:DMT family transporter [Hoeflea prorocentri]MCY6381719.1 DMT family transporter [Hoeflea prorocentri]MDA5399519.1 DMT family transporter [Hoeflea prorocentri]